MKNGNGRFYQKLGLRIEIFREAAGMTREQLGKKVNLSRESIHSIENGRQRVFVDQCLALAKALKIDPEQLMAGAPR